MSGKERMFAAALYSNHQSLIVNRNDSRGLSQLRRGSSADAKACPECGSDEQTGWSETAHAGHLGLPDEEFDHDEFVKEEFGPEPVRPRGIRVVLVAGGGVWLLPA